MPTAVYTDEEIKALRDSGALICQCETPLPSTGGGWGAADECQRCFKLIASTKGASTPSRSDAASR